MITQAAFVPAAEAAFIGGVSSPQMNRLVDEELVPRALLAQEGGARRFARLAAAFARFFFETETILAAAARKQVLWELTLRIEKLQARDQVFALREMPRELDWKVGNLGAGTVLVDVSAYVAEAMGRAKDVDKAEQLVVEDAQVLGGLPCFAGTRVPIETVLASLDLGVSKDRLYASYPFLTDAHIDAASVYAQVHPRRGRPRRLSDSNPSAVPKVTRVVRPAKAWHSNS